MINTIHMAYTLRMLEIFSSAAIKNKKNASQAANAVQRRERDARNGSFAKNMYEENSSEKMA